MSSVSIALKPLLLICCKSEDMLIIRDRVFVRQAKKIDRSILVHSEERLSLLVREEFHPLLNNHSLTGKYRGFRSINITGDWRLVYRRIDAHIIYLRAVGTHHQLYGS